jgi:D-alanyl-D-alanine carboxypeptidase (penicillin-binding protein 5/6)
MNEIAKEIGMKRTNFASAHGMYVEENTSTAADMAKLSMHAMKIQKFREIVKCQERETLSSCYPGHAYKWGNTNFLLKKDPNCTGIKTGITWAAGPCLAASIRKDGYHVCIIILSSCSPDSRWFEVPKLAYWGIKKYQKIKQSTLRPKIRRRIIKSFIYI